MHRATLEEAYLELTGDAVEFRAAGPEEAGDEPHDDTIPSGLAVGSRRLLSALTAEWTKFRTVRGWVIGTIVAGLVIVGIALLAAASGSHVGMVVNGGAGGPSIRWDRAALA